MSKYTLLSTVHSNLRYNIHTIVYNLCLRWPNAFVVAVPAMLDDFEPLAGAPAAAVPSPSPGCLMQLLRGQSRADVSINSFSAHTKEITTLTAIYVRLL
jgi:hypothetical protein